MSRENMKNDNLKGGRRTAKEKEKISLKKVRVKSDVKEEKFRKRVGYCDRVCRETGTHDGERKLENK